MGTTITTIDSVPEDAIKEIMLCLPTPAALVHAALACKSWRWVIADQQFLAEYRKRHASSPFLGLYVPQQFGGLPSFLMADSIRAAVDGDLARAAAKAFSLGGLESHPKWRLLDCHNGRLLLARGDEAVEVYSPLSCECISVCLPEDEFLPEDFSACLLRGYDNDGASFRVVSVQHRRVGRDWMVQAIEYDSCTKIWMDHPSKTLKNINGTATGEMMHAGGLIFCKYNGNSLLLLDTSNMEFSPLPLPADNNPKNYTIGELEDGVCCLLSAECVGGFNNIHLRVWKLQNLKWELEKDMRVREVLGSYTRYPYYKVRAVTNGIALLCSSKGHLHFIIDLKTFRVKEKFEFKDLAAYPFQMPWPPTFCVTAAEEADMGSQALDGPMCTGVQKAGTIHALNEKIEATKFDGQYVECKLNTEDPLIPCNVDVVLLGCSNANPQEECFEENSVPNNIDPETLIPDQDLIPCNQNSVLMHPEATKIHHQAKWKSLASLGNESQSAFAVINELPRKDNIKNPEKRKHTWGPIGVSRKKEKMYSVLCDRECAEAIRTCKNLEQEKYRISGAICSISFARI